MTNSPALTEATETLNKDLSEYLKLQTDKLSDSFELIYQINQAALGRYGELIQEATHLKEHAKTLQSQEIGIASFLGNLSVVEKDVTKLEETLTKLEQYCSLLESKVP
jgi:biogenesis of lysosome-related organelles complex 1 subunit 2